MLIRTDVAFKGISYVSVPFLQILCVEARVGNVSLMQITRYASSLTLNYVFGMFSASVSTFSIVL